MVDLTLPDKSVRAYDDGVTGAEVAGSIAKSLAKKAVAMVVDGELTDLADRIERNAEVEIVTRDDPRALELIRHDAAHVMAEAVQELWPGTQVTIGPVIDNGFYYDFHRDEPFTTDDLPTIEARMREIIARDRPFTKEIWERDEARRVFHVRARLRVADDHRRIVVGALALRLELRVAVCKFLKHGGICGEQPLVPTPLSRPVVEQGPIDGPPRSGSERHAAAN